MLGQTKDLESECIGILWVGCVPEPKRREADIVEIRWRQFTAKKTFPKVASIERQIALASGRSYNQHDSILGKQRLDKVIKYVTDSDSGYAPIQQHRGTIHAY